MYYMILKKGFKGFWKQKAFKCLEEPKEAQIWKTNGKSLFWKVYGKRKPTKLWKTNETSLFVKVYGKPKSAKL